MTLSRWFALIVVLSALAFVTGCSPRLEYVSGPQRSRAQAEEFARTYDASRWRIPPEKAADERESTLASLRTQGDEASVLADLLTSRFSASKGVPVYAEATRVDGVDAWLVIELYGADGQQLVRRRLWIITRPTGDVISSSTYR